MRILLFSLVLAGVSMSVAFSQQLDNSFHSAVPFRAPFTTGLLVQPDGKILMGGNIDYYKNTPVRNLIRLTPAGSLDASFSYNVPAGYFVVDMALANNGDIVVLLREFNPYGDYYGDACKIVVLNSAGQVKVQSGMLSRITAIAVQEDGKVLINGRVRALTRFNADLTEDSAFNSAVSVDGYVADIVVKGDKMFICGQIKKVNNVVKNDIAKLNLDGTLDASFDTGDGTTDFLGSITIAPDGKLLTARAFINNFNGHTFNGMARLNPDGSVDETFSSVSMNGPMGDALVTPEGIYVFTSLELADIFGYYFIRLTDEGLLDESFKPVYTTPEQNVAEPIAVKIGNTFLLTGAVGGGNPYQLSSVDINGAVNPAFAPRISRVGLVRFGDAQNGKLIVGGDFVRIDSVNTFGMARIKFDGSVDNTFVVNENRGVVTQMQLFDDETALVSTNKKFFRLDNQGNTIPEFTWTPGGFLYQVIKFNFRPDGKIVVGDPNTLARLNADGTIDDSFDMGHSSNSTAFDFDMQGDSVIYGASAWNETLEIFETKVQRITPNATIDPTWQVKIGPAGSDPDDFPMIQMIKVLDNKEVLVGGSFDSFEGKPVRHGLVKLSRNGEVDLTFLANQAVAVGPNSFYDTQVEQIGSKVYIRSDFVIYVINTDGTVADFDIPLQVNGISDIVADVAAGTSNGRTQSDDDYIVALGSFQASGSAAPLSVVRLKLAEEPQQPEEPGTVTEVEAATENLALQVYPQPTSGVLNVTFGTNTSSFRTSIYSTSGTKYMEQTFPAGNTITTLDVSTLPSGLYTIKVVSASGKSGYAKFVRVP